MDLSFINWSNSSFDLLLILAFTMSGGSKFSSLCIVWRFTSFSFPNCFLVNAVVAVCSSEYFSEIISWSSYLMISVYYLSTPPNNFLFQAGIIYYLMRVLKIL